MIRVGIVGCGKVAHLHAKALAQFAAATDVDPGRAAAFTRQYGGTPFATLDDMLTSRAVDAVILCTPHPQHAADAIAAAEAGVHVLVEKPLASTVDDADRMIEAAERNRIKLGVVSQRRFYEPVLRMKAAIDAGKIGRPILGTFLMLSWRDEAYYASDPWRGRWDTEGGGVLINQSPHQLDILQWLMGSDVDEVSAHWSNLNHRYIEVEDTVTASLRFSSGALGSIVTSVSQKPGIYTKVHIHGSNGASVGVQTDTGATFVAGMSGIATPPFNDIWTIPGEDVPPPDPAHADPTVHYHKLQVEDFLAAIRQDRPPNPSAYEGRKVVALIEAIYRSGRR